LDLAAITFPFQMGSVSGNLGWSTGNCGDWHHEQQQTSKLPLDSFAI